MTKHTPKPWQFSTGHPTLTVYDGNGQAIADVHGYGARTLEENGANGYLIAAAPEMLEALKANVGSCPHCIGNPMVTSHTKACQLARNAIAKAEGDYRRRE